MGTRKVSFAPGEYYHLYNRGNSKQKIFNNRHDYERFLKLLYLTNSSDRFHFSDVQNPYAVERSERLVSIGAYCLMPNHFHLLVNPIESDVSRFMKKLGTAYSMYFNTKHERVGSLFEGKFKSEHLDSDRYLKYMFSYIHLNPLKIIDKKWKEHGIKNKDRAWQFLNEYKYSSFSDYQKIDREESKILNSEDFPNYFSSTEVFRKEIFDWLNYHTAQAG